MKVYLMHLVSLRSQQIRATCPLEYLLVVDGFRHQASHQGPGATGPGLNQLGDCRRRVFKDYTSLPICNVGHQANTNYGGGLVSFVNLIFLLK